ncbi:MAG: N-acetylgalactosamine 6-sulfate sulfatase, partial [Bacteroidota bacterium]
MKDTLALLFASVLIMLMLNSCERSTKSAYSPPNSPNILCILVDDLGYGDLAIQGATDIQSPNIDAVARQGMSVEQFSATS